MSDVAANDRYILDVLQRRFGTTLPTLKLLDFGCGTGALVEHLRNNGCDAIGADPFDGRYEGWQKPHLHKIEQGHLPFADDAFDIVVSNQVFEHIDDYDAELAEVHRVLKPGGLFLALFPTLETAYEVHTGLWFAWYLKPFPPVLFVYLWLCRAFGFGLWKGDMTVSEWAHTRLPILVKECHYKTQRRITRDWQRVFGTKPETRQADYLRFRLPAARRLPDWLCGLITTIRAGIVITVTK